MESQYLINSIAIGGVFFVGVIVFWFIFVYLKKRLTADKPNQSLSAAVSVPVENKRRHPRVEVSWAAKVENSETSQDVILKDISIGGAFVVSQEPAAMQDRLRIIINLPNSKTLQLNAEVVWSNANMPLDKVVNRGMGIKFIQNEDNKRQKLQDAIDNAALEKSNESV